MVVDLVQRMYNGFRLLFIGGVGRSGSLGRLVGGPALLELPHGEMQPAAIEIQVSACRTQVRVEDYARRVNRLRAMAAMPNAAVSDRPAVGAVS